MAELDPERCERLIAAIDRLTSELRATRERKTKTLRVRTIHRAQTSQDIPVTDIAAAAARRALARSRG